MVGDLALQLVGTGIDPEEFAEDPGRFDIPGSVIGFLNGELGDPPGGWPEPFRTKALQGRTWTAPAEKLSGEQAEGLRTARRRTLNELLFLGPTREFDEARARYGDVSVLSTLDYLYGLKPGHEHVIELSEGKRIIVALQAISEPDAGGYRTVLATLNGQLRPVSVRDRGIAGDEPVVEKADRSNPGDVAAPFQGVVTIAVAEGDAVSAGDTVATIEAMKMEAAITAAIDGTVDRVVTPKVTQVEGGDLLLTVS